MFHMKCCQLTHTRAQSFLLEVGHRSALPWARAQGASFVVWSFQILHRASVAASRNLVLLQAGLDMLVLLKSLARQHAGSGNSMLALGTGERTDRGMHETDMIYQPVKESRIQGNVVNWVLLGFHWPLHLTDSTETQASPPNVWEGLGLVSRFPCRRYEEPQNRNWLH